MKAKLMSQWGAEKGAEFWVGAEAIVGRGADCQVHLDAKPVSSQHARIFFDPETDSYCLEDLGSLNGTLLDGTPVTRVERLGRLHVVEFGGVCELLFITVDTSPEDEAQAPTAETPLSEGTRVEAEAPVLPSALAGDEKEVGPGTRVEEAPVVLPRPLVGEPEGEEQEPAAEKPTPSADETYFVLAVAEEKTSRRFSLRQGENLIGRSRGAEVPLASPQLSRRHALVVVRDDEVTIQDLGSRNHTFIDDRKLEKGVAEVVTPPARLRFGLVEAYLVRRDDDATIPVVPADGK